MNEPLPIFTALTIAVTGIVSFLGFQNPRIVENYLFSTEGVIQRREYHRLFTAGLLHADWTHLLFNMFSLYFFGRNIELGVSPYSFLFIYVVSILGGNLLALVIHRNHEYRALGASGGVCGVIFASIFLMPGGSIMIFPIPIPIPPWLYAIVFILGSYIGMRKGVGNIGHDAHLGGAIIGLLVTTVMYPEIIQRSPLLYLAVMTLSAVLLGLTCFWPMHLPSPLSREHREQARERRREEAEVKRVAAEEQRLEQLLAKISQSGLHSLSESEKRELNNISERRRRNRS